ncbi:MAG: hypothetical protein AB7N61_21790, partial [Acidimicrobiia bacterium]
PVVDRAVERREAMDAFLQQRVDEPVGDDLWNAMAVACGMPPLSASGFVSGVEAGLGAMGAGGMSLALPGEIR